MLRSYTSIISLAHISELYFEEISLDIVRYFQICVKMITIEINGTKVLIGFVDGGLKDNAIVDAEQVIF